MKYLIIILLFIGCTKEQQQPLSAKGGVKGRPPKDTVITPPVVDTPIVAQLPTSHLNPVAPILQGAESSCVAVALVYGHSQLTGELMSPEWIYNNCKLTTCASGMSIITGLNWLKNKGGRTWQDIPYNDRNGCEAITGVGTHFISGWTTILGKDTTGIKKALLSGKVLPFTHTLDYSIWFMPESIWYDYIYPVYGPHAGAVIGYDAESFICMGTYGKTFRVAKSSFSKLAYECFVLY